MTDLICFAVKEEFAERIKLGLERDFYKHENVFATGSPVFVERSGGLVLFMCPVFYPVGGFVKKMVSKQVFNGFRSSFARSGIKIVQVKANDKIKALFEASVKDSLGVDVVE